MRSRPQRILTAARASGRPGRNAPLPLASLVALVLPIAALLAGSPAPALAGGPDECNGSHPGWVFCSGFEEGSLSLWDDYDGNPPTTNTLMLDPGPLGASGNHVMRLHVPAGRGGADLVKVLPQGYDRLYARWYVKWDAGYDFTIPNHGGGLFAGSRDYLGQSGYRPTGSDWFSSWLEPLTSNGRLNSYTYYRGMYQDCADPNGSCWGDHFPCMMDEGQSYCKKAQDRETVLPPVLEVNRWYCIEVMMDGGTPTTTGTGANGVFDYWIDGVEIGPWSDLWLRTSSSLKLDILYLSLFYHDTHPDAGIMIDDVVISTQRIGPRARATTAVGETPVPEGYVLKANVPNPFNPRTTLRFELPVAESIRLGIYDIEGRLVRRLIDGLSEPGQHAVVWDGKDGAGRDLASGVYLAHLEAGGKTLIGRMSLVR
jgi:hypothetical protein